MNSGMSVFRLGVVVLAVQSWALGATPVLTIQASSDVGTASMTVDVAQCSWDAVQRAWLWSDAQPVDLTDHTNGLVVATVQSASLVVRGHSRYEVMFGANAGTALT